MGLMESKSLCDFILSTCTREKETVTKYVYTDLYCYKMIHTGDRFCFGWIGSSLPVIGIKKASQREMEGRTVQKITLQLFWTLW